MPSDDKAKHGKSAVTNGFKYLEDCDGRSPTFRRYRDLAEGVTSDLGGPDRLSTIQLQLARRIGGLGVLCEALESKLCADGKLCEEDLAAYATLTNALGRTAARLGIKRASKDVTLDLHDYIRQRDGAP
ncbi:MAG: hypothetical protein R3322_08865 [Kiloniellales bacterium]|nr:hypothetical protein [Kiloniellales bacterium]